MAARWDGRWRKEETRIACVANRLELLSISIESTGCIDEPCNPFLRKVLKTYSKDNESVHRAYSNYWLSRLSCCLQKSIAASIVNRSNGLMVTCFTTPTINLMRPLFLNPNFDISIITVTMIFDFLSLFRAIPVHVLALLCPVPASAPVPPCVHVPSPALSLAA
jgi:hypothetical protein